MADLSILDGSVANLREKAADLPLDDLLALLGAEQIGKTRKGAIAALEEMIAASAVDEPVIGPDAPDDHIVSDFDEAPLADDEPPGSVIEIPPGMALFTNETAGTCIHLGDGRKLAPGESAAVSPELLAQLKA